MKFILVNSLLLVVLSYGVMAKDLPNSFTKCKRNDPNLSKCLADAITAALITMRSGVPEFNILPLEPLAVKALTIEEGINSPISLRQEFKNIQLIHLTDSSVVTKVTPDFENFHMSSETFTPKLEFIADYSMEGRILVLPISGKGRSNITMTDLTTKHEVIGEKLIKKGEIYMKIKEYRIKLMPKNVQLNFENLFNGDKALAENMNRFLNENWEIVFNEVKSGYEKTFGLVFKEITNKLFTKVPMRKIFLEDE